MTLRAIRLKNLPMLKKLKDDQGLKILVILASVVVIIFGLRAAESFFAPVLLAFFIATISFPITNWLREHRVPRMLAVLTTVLVDFAFLTGIILIAFSLVGDLQLGWEVKYQRLSMEKIVDSEQWAVGILTEWKVEDPAEKVREYVTGDLLAQLSSMSDILDVSKNVIGGVASFFAASFIVLILTVFMLTEARMYGRRLNAICEARGPDLQRLLSASKDIQRFLGIKTAVSLTDRVVGGFSLLGGGSGLLSPVGDFGFYAQLHPGRGLGHRRHSSDVARSPSLWLAEFFGRRDWLYRN